MSRLYLCPAKKQSGVVWLEVGKKYERKAWRQFYYF